MSAAATEPSQGTQKGAGRWRRAAIWCRARWRTWATTTVGAGRYSGRGWWLWWRSWGARGRWRLAGCARPIRPLLRRRWGVRPGKSAWRRVLSVFLVKGALPPVTSLRRPEGSHRWDVSTLMCGVSRARAALPSASARRGLGRPGATAPGASRGAVPGKLRLIGAGADRQRDRPLPGAAILRRGRGPGSSRRGRGQLVDGASGAGGEAGEARRMAVGCGNAGTGVDLLACGCYTGCIDRLPAAKAW